MYKFLVLILVLFQLLRAEDDIKLKCDFLNPLQMRVGHTIYIPANSTAPFLIPPNFNCTYTFLIPRLAFLRIRVINSLLDDDYIEFTDSLGYQSTLTTTAIANEEFFATTGKGRIRIVTGSEGRSKALLVFQWFQMPSSNWTELLSKNSSGKYVDCQSLHLVPITFKTSDPDEKVALNVAHSGYILDKFDSFFVFDGPGTDSQVLGRMSDHIIVPIIPSNQSITVIGLTSLIIYSNIIANYESNINKYRKYEAAVIINQQGTIIDSIDQTIAVTFIAKEGLELYLTSLRFNEVENDQCIMTVISGTPSPISKRLLDYTPSSPLHHAFPQQFPSPVFSIELTDCSIYIVISKNIPPNFSIVESGRVGYVFTPSYLDQGLPSELNFTLSSNETLTFSTIVESVNVVDDEQLAINVYKSNGNSAMSILVTGNQTGGCAEGIGSSVNIGFNGTHGKGSAAIRYTISKNFDVRNTIFIAFFAVFIDVL